MGDKTKIEWCDATFNCWIGCQRVARGCEKCYAESFAKRYGKATWGANGTRVKTSDAYWRKPIKWNRDAERDGVRRRVFCASLADVFEDWQGPLLTSEGGELVHLHHGPMAGNRVGVCRSGQMLVDPFHKSTSGGPVMVDGYRAATMSDLRADLFKLIDATPHLDWLLLTKRPENICKMLHGSIPKLATAIGHKAGTPEANIWYRRNVWLGTSIATQEDAGKNIPALLKCRDLSPVLFVSAEPLLGPIDLRRVYIGNPQLNVNADEKIDWLITGGESGHGARAMHPDWARSLRDQCQAAGVAFHFKQWGEWRPITPLYDGRDEAAEDGCGDLEMLDRRGHICSPDIDGQPTDPRTWLIERIGKKAAGRLLDGREWNEFPIAKLKAECGKAVTRG